MSIPLISRHPSYRRHTVTVTTLSLLIFAACGKGKDGEPDDASNSKVIVKPIDSDAPTPLNNDNNIIDNLPSNNWDQNPPEQSTAPINVVQTVVISDPTPAVSNDETGVVDTNNTVVGDTVAVETPTVEVPSNTPVYDSYEYPEASAACDGDYATGVTVDAVDVNQGVETRIVEGGELTAVDGRNVQIIGGRGAVVQAFWEGSAGEVDACIEIVQKDGETKAYYTTVDTGSSARKGSLEGAASWLIDPDDLRGDTEFSVHFFEEGTGEQGPSLTEAQNIARGGDGARFPDDGEASFGAIGDPMPLHTVVVPSNCSWATTNDFTVAAAAEAMRGQIFNNHPGSEEEADIVLHAPAELGCDPWLPELATIRTAENLGAEYIYSAIVGPEKNGSGLGYLCEPSDTTCDRVNWAGTFSFGGGIHLYGNVIHEMGHNFNRSHTFEDSWYEPQSEAYRGGRLSWGFGLWGGEHSNGIDMRHFFFAPDEYFDVNSYEQPWSNQFVSAYTYRAYTEAIQIWGGWIGPDGAEAREQRNRTRSISAVLTPDGEMEFSYVLGNPPEEFLSRSADNYVTLAGAEGARSKTGYRAKLTSDGVFRGLVFGLPEKFEQMNLTGFEMVVDGRSYTGSMDEVENAIPAGDERTPW